LGRGSLYGVFGDKHSLYLRALDTDCAAVQDRNHHQLRESSESPHNRIITHIRQTIRSTISDTKRRGSLVAAGASELASADPGVAQRVKGTLMLWHLHLADTVAEAQRDGDITADIHPQEIASLLLAVLKGNEAVHKGGAPSTTVTAAASR
jgi:TetR/AcrR family transcriptional repressor of nem operon